MDDSLSSAEVGHGPGEQPGGQPGEHSAEARVAVALARLDRLDERELAEHASVLDGVHEQLRAVLAEIDGA